MALLSKELLTATPMQKLKIPDHDDWTRIWPEIEHLYIVKRYKLRHIMRHIERTHGLKATEQMYKKRFARWGLQKNSRRTTSDNPDAGLSRIKRREANQTDTGLRKSTESILHPPHLPDQHRLSLTMFQSVQTWSTSYFEDWDPTKSLFATTGQYPIVVSDFVYALKLVNDLLSRGQGQLAGRVTRKAFLMLEDAIIAIDGPALIWNLLEIMHHMITLRQKTLCESVLAYLCALTDCKMTKSHPLYTMLSTLNELLTSNDYVDREPYDSPTSSTDAPSATSADSPPSSVISNEQQPSSLLTDLLERSWVINAETMFKNLDLEHFGLYCNIAFDLCSLRLRASELKIARQWFNRIDAQREEFFGTGVLNEEKFEDDGRIQERILPLPLHMNSDSAQEFGKLRANSIASLRRDWDSIIQTSTDFDGDNTLPIRILCALVSANALPWSTTTASSDAACVDNPDLSRLHAGHIASAIRTSLDIRRNEYSNQNADDPNIIDSIRATIALSEYAYGRTDPRVVRELWLLQDAFSGAGDTENARETEKDAFDRLNKYVCDIPLDCA